MAHSRGYDLGLSQLLYSTFIFCSQSRYNPCKVTLRGKITPQGDLSSVVPLPVGRYMNAFVTLPNYVCSSCEQEQLQAGRLCGEETASPASVTCRQYLTHALWTAQRWPIFTHTYHEYSSRRYRPINNSE